MSEDSDSKAYFVLKAARDLKQHVVNAWAKEAGTHDPDLPESEVSDLAIQEAILALFKELTALDGPLDHELPMIAEMERELAEEKERT